MEKDEIVRDIGYIREVIESSNRYTNVSGLAGILCGVFALAGCGATWLVFGSPYLPYGGSVMYDMAPRLPALGIIWLAVFVLSVLAQVLLTVRKAKKIEVLPWTKLSRQVLFVLMPAFLAGGIGTVFLVRWVVVCLNVTVFIPPVWMLLYGVGVAACGAFSVPAVRVLGWAFILTSVFPLFVWPEYGLIFLALSFGVYHIIYGIAVCIKYKG